AFTFVSCTQLLAGVFQKHLIYYQISTAEIIQRLVMLAGTAATVSLHLTLVYFILLLAFANAVQFFVTLHLARRVIPFGLSWDWQLSKEILSKSWTLGLSMMLNLIYFRADTILLSAFKSPADVGIYGLSYKVLEMLLVFPAMFSGLILPILSRS